jgi:hypothetical protein
MDGELEQARQERDTAFSEFMKESAAATKHTIKARAARAKYMRAQQEVRAIERDLLAFPVGQ